MNENVKLTDLDFIFHVLLEVPFEHNGSVELCVGLSDLIEKELIDENNRLKRIPYELIADYVFKSDETLGEENESFLAFIEALKDLPNEHKHDGCIDVFCEKVTRHYRLSKIQRDYIDRNINSLRSGIIEAQSKLNSFNVELSTVHQDFSNQVEDVQSSVDNSKRDLEKKIQENNNSMTQTKDKLMSEFVGILGIFSGLIFAFFGGINTVQSALSDLANGAPVGKSIIMLSFTAAGLVSFLYFTLSWIGKLMDKSIYSCGCNQKKCNHSLLQRHSTYFFILLLLLLFIVSGSIIMVSKSSGITESFDPFLLIAMLIIIIGVIFYCIWSLININRVKSEDKQISSDKDPSES